MRRNISTRTATSYFSRSLVACIALVLALPSLARAETDYGALFYSIPLSSSVEEVEKLLAARQDFKVRTEKNADGTTSVRGDFQGGWYEARFRDGKIELMNYRVVDRYPLDAIRRIDTTFVNKLGRVGYIQLKGRDIYFEKSAYDGCLQQCASKCGKYAPSAYYCAAGEVCQAACLSNTLPRHPAQLQQFLYERLAQSKDDGEYSSFWACNSHASITRVVSHAPDGCFMSLGVDSCRASKQSGTDTLACGYSMVFYDRPFNSNCTLGGNNCRSLIRSNNGILEQIEDVPLVLKSSQFQDYAERLPAGTELERRTDKNGDLLVGAFGKNDQRVFRFTPSGDLLVLTIEHRLMPIEEYRANVVSLIWQHGTPNYVVVPTVAGYPRGAAKACLSPSDQPGKLKLDVPCLEKHLPKEPAAFASWVNDSINRLGRHPDLLWTCKQSATGPTLIAPKGHPGECYVKISAGNDCSGTREPATCHQLIKYSNVDLATERERLARSDAKGDGTANPESSPAAESNVKQAEPTADALIAEGKAALDRNDPDTAINRFRRAEKKMTGFSRALHDLIDAAQTKIQERDFSKSQTRKAAGPVRTAPETVRDPDELRKQRIRTAFRKATEAAAFGNLELQIAALSEVLEIDPENSDALRSRQESLEKMGRLELALKDAEKRVAINADDVFGQRDVTRLKRQIRAALQKVATEKSTKAPSESAETIQIENLEKPYDINGLSLTADLSAIEAFLKGRAGSSFKRSESDGEVRLEGGADDGRWLVVYDTNNGALLRAEFTSEKISIEAKRKTYAAIMRKYGMPFHIESDYGKLLAQRASSYSDASQELKDDFVKMDQCYSTCCGGSDSIEKCAPTPPVNACFNDCYYPKPPREVEALLNWLFAEKASVAQRRLLHDGVRSTYWSCSRLPAGDVLRNRERRACRVRFDVNTYNTDFKYSLRFENASAIQRSDEQQAQIRKQKEKIEREKARQSSAQAYRNETAAKEARYAAIDDKIAKRYPYIAPERLEFMREKWRSYEDFKVWMASELKQPYWQKIPEAEREAKLLDALTKNDFRPGGPSYNDPYARDAAQDYLHFDDRRRAFDTDNTRAMIDKATTEPEFAAITDEKARRTAAIAELQKREPARMKAYFDELGNIRHCYNSGSVPAGKIGGVTTYKQAPGCFGYTTARDVNAGMAKRPSWEP